MKLISITFGTTPRLPGLRPVETGHIECDNPSAALAGWRFAIRGTQVHFISPPGWHRDQAQKRDAKGGITAYGPFPIGDVYLQWQFTNEAELATLLKGKLEFDSPPFGWKPAPVESDKPLLAQVPAGQMGDA